MIGMTLRARYNPARLFASATIHGRRYEYSEYTNNLDDDLGFITRAQEAFERITVSPHEIARKDYID